MLRYLHQLSACAFYLLGTSFLVAYVFLQNDMGALFAEWWLRVMDLPLLLAGTLYGGLSFYFSLSWEEEQNFGLTLGVGIVLLLLFSVFALMNFWPILSR